MATPSTCVAVVTLRSVDRGSLPAWAAELLERTVGTWTVLDVERARVHLADVDAQLVEIFDDPFRAVAAIEQARFLVDHGVRIQTDYGPVWITKRAARELETQTAPTRSADVAVELAS